MPAYFNQLPEIQYPSRTSDSKISDYVVLKNIFKRGKIRDDIFSNLVFFTKYQVKGDDRPDNVAFEFYGDETLDWLVLISNNIINIQTEWPLGQQAFYNYLIEKYGSESGFENVHHYETIDVKNSQGQIMVPKGLIVPSNYVARYYDPFLQQYVQRNDVVRTITNYVYEDNIQTEKRNIFVLKSEYLNVILDDLKEIMKYEKGSTQYVSRTLKKTNNIRLYQ
jgi:hypothetical protein